MFLQTNKLNLAGSLSYMGLAASTVPLSDSVEMFCSVFSPSLILISPSDTKLKSLALTDKGVSMVTSLLREVGVLCALRGEGDLCLSSMDEAL